ncbi:hypothetical protein ACFU6I_03890 [Streptomyces sp. NPDC057486]|uniref:hypothetical protein n=1 Tax=Streptomyces sp. NPDC057486 TaxID=3346145 RepID=UPI00369F96DA
MRRAAPLRLAELLTGTTWGECAPALGISAGSGRRTLQVLGHRINPAGLWPAFEEVVEGIAHELDSAEERVNYAKRRHLLEDWRLPHGDWIRLREEGPLYRMLSSGMDSALGTVLVWSEVTQAERSQCPVVRPPNRVEGAEKLAALAAWYDHSDLSQTSPRFWLRRLLKRYAGQLGVTCDLGRPLHVDVTDILRTEVAATATVDHPQERL